MSHSNYSSPRASFAGRINKQRSNPSSRSASPIKQKQKLKEGVDLGIDLLVNKKFSPPSSPTHPKPRSLKLSGSSSDGSFDDRFSRLVNKNRKPNDPRNHTSNDKIGPPRRIIDRSTESSRMVPRHVERSRGSEPSERSHKGQRSDRSERSHRSHKSDRSERSHRDHRSDRSERDDRSERGFRSERGDRSERDDRSERGDRSEKRDHRSERKSHRSDRTSGGLRQYLERRDLPSFHGSDFDDSELDKDINDVVIEESSRDDKRNRNKHRDDHYHIHKKHHDDDSSRRDLLDSDFDRNHDRDQDHDQDEPDKFDDRPAEERLSPEELLKLKRKKLLHIKVMTMQGYEPFRPVGLMNTVEEINEVEEEQMARRGLANAIEFQKKLLVGFSYLVEMGNKKYDPFDLNLEGWSDQIYEERDEYNEVLEELYYKYSDHVTMIPEVKLVMMLGMSAMMFNFSKKLMDNGNIEVPGFEQIMRNNPELRRHYTEAAKNEMSRQSGSGPGPGSPNGSPTGGGNDFMSGILGSMTGNPQTGNMLNQFMNMGGKSMPPKNNNPRPRGPAGTGRSRESAGSGGPRAKRDVDILPPVDMDNILDNSLDSLSSVSLPKQQRKTRNNRNNISQLVI